MNSIVIRLIALLGVLALPGPALADAVVIRSNPPDRAVLTRVPEQIMLKFNTQLAKKLVHVKLDRADGATQTLVDTAREPTVVRVRLPADLQAGPYTVHYRVLASDGHATQGVLRFKLQGLR